MTIAIFRTDTLYGVGCNINEFKEVNRIYRIKGKSFNENLSFLVTDVNEIMNYAEVSSKQFEKVRDLLKKGSHYTFCFKKRKDVSLNLSKNDEIGIRVLNNSDTRIITKLLGGPVICTSANIHGTEAPKRFEDIDKIILGSAEIKLNSGDCYYGKASIVYDLVNDRIKRE